MKPFTTSSKRLSGRRGGYNLFERFCLPTGLPGQISEAAGRIRIGKMYVIKGIPGIDGNCLFKDLYGLAVVIFLRKGISKPVVVRPRITVIQFDGPFASKLRLV
jgi:hypothetical protein